MGSNLRDSSLASMRVMEKIGMTFIGLQVFRGEQRKTSFLHIRFSTDREPVWLWRNLAISLRLYALRRGWDSNIRWRQAPQRFSRPSHSTTLAPLRFQAGSLRRPTIHCSAHPLSPFSPWQIFLPLYSPCSLDSVSI